MVATNQKPDYTDSNTQQQTGTLQITSGKSLICNKKVQQQKWSLKKIPILTIYSYEVFESRITKRCLLPEMTK